MVTAMNRPRAPRFREEDTGGFTERVVLTRRIAKVVKGGRRPPVQRVGRGGQW